MGTKRTKCPSCNQGKTSGLRPVQKTDADGKKYVEQVMYHDLPCTACDSSGSLWVYVEDDDGKKK